MNEATRDRLFGFRHAFDSPVTVVIVGGVAALLALAPLLIASSARRGNWDEGRRTELWNRYWSWLVLVPLMGVPVLLGAAWTIAGMAILSMLAYREFARVTGLADEPTVYYPVYGGILALYFAVFDNWYGFFAALVPLTIASIAAITIVADRPAGYLKRVALGVLGFMLFGAALANLAYFANDRNYRPLMLMLFVAVELNDVFAYLVGKKLGRFTPKLAPHTSPNKTVAGALGALLLTTLLVSLMGHFVFAGTVLAQPGWLIVMGMLISGCGQLGDLMLSSIKRDLGVKDMGDVIPGHGGVLDRFDSIILVAPAMFHLVNYFNGVGLDQQARIFTGS
jgi:phosphatidate cytidylyltransferase